MSPCKDCEERYIGCHGDCEKYKSFYEQNEKIKANIRKEKEKDKEIGAYIAGQRIKNKTLYQDRFK